MVISGPWKLQNGFSWLQGPETAKKVSFQAPEKAKMSERFFMCFVYILKHAWNIPENSLETCFKYISRLFYGCFNGVLRVYYGCLLVGEKIVVKKFFCQKNFIHWNVILVEKFFVSKNFLSWKILDYPNFCNSTISEIIKTKNKLGWAGSQSWLRQLAWSLV